ncbi:fungal-specific transcription factor domain-containing protein [Mycena crocata]|nr:fungal-specific transcription factor domain-containing protein [Mycena crocata]
MSTKHDESEPGSNQENLASRKRHRACDMCRRKKRQCDGGDRCTHCVARDFTCTYVDSAPARATAPLYDFEDLSDSQAAYITNLQSRLDAAQSALRDFQARRQAELPMWARGIRNLIKPFAAPHPDDAVFIDIADSLRALSLESAPPDPGFQGKSGTGMLVKAALSVKPGGTPPPQSHHASPSPTAALPKPWMLRPWRKENPPPIPAFSYPEQEHIATLVKLYFTHVNLFVPLLHRPTFEGCVEAQFHLRDTGFGTTLLLVCALGALYLPVGTERNYLPTYGVRSSRDFSLPWALYNQVQLCGHALYQQPTLYDLQTYCLAASFLHFAANPRFAWAIIGFGLRLAQDVGAHRRKARGETVTGEEELEKRAFWILLLMDNQLSGALGRSAVIDLIEIDISLPNECDDEGWPSSVTNIEGSASYRHQAASSSPWRQPSTRPSTLAFFNCVLNLYRITNFTLRSFYSTTVLYRRNGAYHFPSFVVELDAALDAWVAAIPRHLTWDPTRPKGSSAESQLFCTQSAALHCFYCYARILVHRPFIPGTSLFLEPDPRALDRCTEAARSCIAAAEAHQRWSTADGLLMFSQTPLFTAAMVLVLRTRGSANGQTQPDHDILSDSETDDKTRIHTAIAVLTVQRERWPSSEFFVAILERLIGVEASSEDPPSLPGVPAMGDYCMPTAPEDGLGPFRSVSDLHVNLDDTHSPFEEASFDSPGGGISGLGSHRRSHPRIRALNTNSHTSQSVEIPPAFMGDADIRVSWPRPDLGGLSAGNM